MLLSDNSLPYQLINCLFNQFVGSYVLISCCRHAHWKRIAQSAGLGSDNAGTHHIIVRTLGVFWGHCWGPCRVQQNEAICCWVCLDWKQQITFNCLRSVAYVAYDLQYYSARVFCNMFETFDVHTFEISKNIIFENDEGFCLNSVELFCVSKVGDNWFWESWTRPKIRKSSKLWRFKFSQSVIEKLLVQGEAE